MKCSKCKNAIDAQEIQFSHDECQKDRSFRCPYCEESISLRGTGWVKKTTSLLFLFFIAPYVIPAAVFIWFFILLMDYKP